MKKLLALLGLATCLAPAAHALDGPHAIEIDGGPLGSVQISGGADGFGYYLSGTGDKQACNFNIYCQVGDKPSGAEVLNYLLEVQKTTGILQATVMVGATSSLTLGTPPIPASFGNISPLYEGYVSIVPNANFTLSVGQVASLEGFEGLPDWTNGNMLASLLYYTQNTVARGATLAYTNTADTINASLEFGDGYRTGVFNYLQFLVGYNFQSGAYLDLYGAYNLGRSGLNSVGAYGPTASYPGEYNSNMIGAYFGGYSIGHLSLTPEVQFQYTKPDAIIGVPKESDTYGALLLADYSFGYTPYSLGGFLEYANCQGADTTWFIGPNAEAVGASIAPTWQRHNLFARVNAGYLYLLNNKADGVTYGYGSNNNGKGVFTGVLEAGVLF